MDIKRLDDYGLTVLVTFIIIFFIYEITNTIILIYCLFQPGPMYLLKSIRKNAFPC